MLTDQATLRHIERQPHHSAGYKQLVREMNLRGDDRRQLAERLEALVKSARLIATGRDRYTLAEHAATRQNLIAGRLTMHRDGYGFVIPNAGQRRSHWRSDIRRERQPLRRHRQWRSVRRGCRLGDHALA